MKKLLSFCLSIILLLGCASALYGCGGEKHDPDELRLFVINGNLFDGVEKDATWLEIEKNSGTKFRIEGAFNNDDYYTTLMPMINTQDFPDVFFCVPSGTGDAYNQWTDPDDGILWNLDELLAMYPDEFPYLRKVLYSDQYSNIMYNNQHTLIINMSPASGWGIYYRADCIKNVGEVNEDGSAKVPVTIEDFERVMKKFSENDPDKNGKKDTYGMSPGNSPHFFNPLYHAFGVTPGWDIDANGNVSFMYTSDKCRDFLEWYHDCYNKGWVEPTFNTNSSDSDRTRFELGKSGILITNAEDHVIWAAGPAIKLYGADSVIMGPPPVGTDNLGEKGSIGFSNWGGWWGGFSITKSCKDPHAALSLFEYLNSPEGSFTRAFGIKDYHYSIDENGGIIPNIENRAKDPAGRWREAENENGDIEPNGAYQLGEVLGAMAIDWEKTEQTGTISFVIDYKMKSIEYWKLMEQANNYMVLKSSNLTNVTSFPSSISVKQNKINDVATAYFLRAIMGLDKLDDAGWNKMVADCAAEGMSDVEAVVKETARDLGIID